MKLKYFTNWRCKLLINDENTHYPSLALAPTTHTTMARKTVCTCRHSSRAGSSTNCVGWTFISTSLTITSCKAASAQGSAMTRTSIHSLAGLTSASPAWACLMIFTVWHLPRAGHSFRSVNTTAVGQTQSLHLVSDKSKSI